MAGEHTDGRRAKGERRRQALIDAALRVVERDGVAGVSHRAVAREAAVPKTAATYYFDTIDDLLVAALTASCEAYGADLAAIAELPGEEALDRLAELMAHAADRRVRLVAEYELYLLAARRPALRPAARVWTDLLSGLVRRYTDDPVVARSVVGLVDGLMVDSLIRDEPASAPEFREVLDRVLRPERQPSA